MYTGFHGKIIVAEIDIITKIYAHILDEDRKINAQRFENAFDAQPALRGMTTPGGQTAAADPTVLLRQLSQSPQLMNTLAFMIVAQAFSRSAANVSY